jgi:hypothetical protein
MRANLRRLALVLSVALAASGCDGKLTGKTGPGGSPGGGTPDTPDVPPTPWEAVAPPVYLAKVKNLLTGVTLGAALGVPAQALEDNITQGKVVSAALA